MKRFVPWIILAVAAASIAANWLPRKATGDDFDFSRFGRDPRARRRPGQTTGHRRA